MFNIYKKKYNYISRIQSSKDDPTNIDQKIKRKTLTKYEHMNCLNLSSFVNQIK